MKTIEQVKQDFHYRGETINAWSKRHGFSVATVQRVLHGKSQCKFGASHKIAVLLGLKEGEIIE